MFKIGQKVVCILREDEEWYDSNTGLSSEGPSPNEILTIDFFDKGGYLGFFKYNFIDGYHPRSFRPLDYEFVEDVIKEIIKKPIFLS